MHFSVPGQRKLRGPTFCIMGQQKYRGSEVCSRANASKLGNFAECTSKKKTTKSIKWKTT